MTNQNDAGNSDNKGIDVNKQDNGGGQGGNDPNKNGTGNTPTFEVSKLGDEDFQKVFDDPRIWNHPRFKSLGERAKQAERLEAERKAAEEKALAEQGKWKELAESKAKEAETVKQQLQEATINNRIIAEAQKQGVVDVEAVLKLIDRTGIKADDGAVTGVDVAVKQLLDTKTYLKGNGSNVNIGSGTNPGEKNATGKRFKLSQIQDPVFYRANAKDIEQSFKLGLIEDDTSKK